jgi:hypothetical protein
MVFLCANPGKPSIRYGHSVKGSRSIFVAATVLKKMGNGKITGISIFGIDQ